MQSLDSSCQEADFIINDALLKLKGSSIQSNSSNSLRQSLSQQQLYQPLQQHHSILQHTTLSGLQSLHHQPPSYLFDGAYSPPDLSAISPHISDHDLLAAVDISDSHQQIGTLPSPSLLSNINSIISPSPVVPEMLLSTSSTSPTTIKPEKRSLLSSSDNSNHLFSSSSPSKKPKLINSSIYGESSSSPISQPLPSSSSSLGIINNNLISPPSSLIQQNVFGDVKCSLDQLKSSKVIYSTSTSSIQSQATSIASDISQANYAPLSSSTSSHQASSSSGSATINAGTPSSSSNSVYFDIHDKIRELYLYLLIYDEKGLRENRRKHRTRSFVLERLVQREKLHTIVLNLFPGNKGYSLAFYQDDNERGINLESINSTSNIKSSSDCISNSTIRNDAGEELVRFEGKKNEGAGGSLNCIEASLISKGNKFETNGSSSRLKQAQISLNSLNNRDSNNLLLTSNEDGDEFKALDEGNFKCRFENTTRSDINSSANASHADSISPKRNGDYTDMDEDDNLVEIMRWPYEIEDLLKSIDNEELPIFISDLLEARIPNVFYSGCVICQIRDYRQVFTISSNSCDIYHVLLKPSNEILYSDINQLSIESDISNDDKLILESQLILATSEPLCLDPDPKIGRFAINSQHRRQMWNTSLLRRQMKKYSQISINRKRKVDQFTHNYGLELCDYLQRVHQRQRPTTTMRSSGTKSAAGNNCTVSSSNNNNITTTPTLIAATTSKLSKNSTDVLRPIRTPNLIYPPLSIPEEISVEKHAKAYERPRETKDFMPQLIEDYTLEADREGGHVYHIKLSIFQRPANSEYIGELYVDRVYKEGERNGEACQFSLGTRAYANRYIQQFTEIFTEEGRKSVKIIHKVPGQLPKISYTTGMSVYKKQQKQHHQQAVIAAALQQQLSIVAAPQQQLQLPQLFQTNQQATPVLNVTNSNTLHGNQVNINLQGGNIMGVTTSGNVQQLRPPAQQIFDSTRSSVSVQKQPGQQINLNNGSLVLVQHQPSGSSVQTGLTIQAASSQHKAQLIGNSNQLPAGNTIRTQIGSNVPILQAQLKASPSVTGQQQIMQQKASTTIHSSNHTVNAYVAGFMNVSNSFQQQQQKQQQQQVQTVQQHGNQPKTTNNAAIISLLNSAPAAMTNSSVHNTFTAPTNQQPQSIVQQQSQQTHGTENLIQQPQRKPNEVIQNLLTNNLRKINMSGSSQGLTSAGRANANVIAVGLSSDGTSTQNVRVTMSALASQLASPPALMTNANFAYAATANNNNNIAINNNNIKILNNSGQRIISASAFRRDSITTAVPSPSSDSNASNTSGTSNLGFVMPGLNALPATSPSSSSDQSQTAHGTSVGGSVGNIGSNFTNQALFDRLTTGTSASPSLTPQQPTNVTKNLVQHVNNVQSPAASISPLSSPPPQQSPQQVVQQTTQTTTLNLQGINLQSLQGAMATFPGLQNVQVQIPGLTQPISLSLSGAGLAAAVQQQASVNANGNSQQTSVLVSVPVTSTTQNNMQSVPDIGGGGSIVPAIPASVCATQTVVLTNTATSGNSQTGVTGSMLSLPIAQLVASGVKGLNPQTLRTAVPCSSGNTIGNSNIIQTSSVNANIGTGGGVNINNTAGSTPIQLLGTLQQRPRNVHVISTKQISNRGQSGVQRNLPNSASLKLGTTLQAQNHITTTTNITNSPLVMPSQKLQLKLQKQNASQQSPPSHNQQQRQHQQHLQLSGVPQQNSAVAAIAAANQKRRRSATDVNK